MKLTFVHFRPYRIARSMSMASPGLQVSMLMLWLREVLHPPVSPL
jgi:hypothetical protein